MSARARRKRERKRQRKANEQQQRRRVQGHGAEDPTMWVRCRFYKQGTCDYSDGTPCVHGTPHEVYIDEEMGPMDYCSGECPARGLQTWCTKVR